MRKNIINFGVFLVLIIGISFSACSDNKNADNKLSIQTNSGYVTIEAFSENTIRIRVQDRKKIKEKNELVVLDLPPYKGKVQIDENSLSTSSLKVIVDQNGKISFTDLSGNILLNEGSRELKKVTVLGESTNNIKQEFIFDDSEAIYGFGQHQSGILNYRGNDVLLVQNNTIAVVPFFVSSKSYGVLWNNYSQTEFRDSSDTGVLWSEVADGIDYFFISGENVDQVIGGYRELTGQAPLFGKWAYGLWVCKEHYHTQMEILNAAKEFRERKIPFDNIVQDWFYWMPSPTGSHDFDPSRYPDPAGMVNDLHNKYNAHVMLSVWSNFGEGSKNYEEFILKDHLFPTGYFDPYSKTGRDIYWKQIRDSLYTKGFDAWWLDATEPELDQIPLEDSVSKVKMNNALGTGAEYLNTYSIMVCKSVYEGLRKENDQKRPFILTRSSFAGQQRYAAATWSGDIFGQWDVLKKQVIAGINFSLSGIPWWTTDIGGFTIPDYPGGNLNDEYKELYTRWFQFGTFCPLFRIHGSITEREPWNFGKEGDWTYDTQLKFIKLRYSLMPYIYSMANSVTANNETAMRGLVFDFPNDQNVLIIDDQYMFGKSIMVCPVLEPHYFRDWETMPSFAIASSKENNPAFKISSIKSSFYATPEYKNLLKETMIDQLVVKPFQFFATDSVKPTQLACRWETEIEVNEHGLYQFMTTTATSPWGQKIKLIIDSTLVIGQSSNMFNGTGKAANVHLQKGKKHSIRLEYICYPWEQPEISLSLRKIDNPEYQTIPKPYSPATRIVYLPEGSSWFDFWTEEKLEGGQAIQADASLDKLPLYIKSGSIIPFGPDIQYVAEKPADTISLKIYPGANGSFELYEDEGDNFNYEDNIKSTISFSWNDQGKTLSIGKRQGEFPGMLKERKIKIMLVGESILGKTDRGSSAHKIISYSGEEMKLTF